MKRVLQLLLGIIITGCGAAAIDSTTPTTPPEREMVQTTEPVMKETDTGAQATEEVSRTATATEEASSSELDHADLLDKILFFGVEGADVLKQIRESGDTQFVAALIDILRYQRDLTDDIGFTLNTLTGENLQPDWFEWVEWAGKHPEIKSFTGYPGWKAKLLAQIDPDFLRFVNPDMKVDPGSRVEEIVWGGVRVDGIPALDNPTMIDPEEADYLIPNERIFGVSINDDTRAYPARFLDWHEMFNDVVGGEPVSLAY